MTDRVPFTERQLALKAEIESQITSAGGYTRDTLAKWGVPWPPPKGWKKKLIREAK